MAEIARLVALCCLAAAMLLAVAGCSGAGTSSNTGSSAASSTVGAHMAGAVEAIHVSQEMVAKAPKAWVLTTPESAVRSYLDWTSYAYSIGQSNVATPTMSGNEGVRVDSYNQYNLQKKRFIDQALASIAFGGLSVGSTSTLVPAKEQWTYRYLSTEKGNKVLGGPYTASYDVTYTVVKSKDGGWVVDAVAAKPLGTVK